MWHKIPKCYYMCINYLNINLTYKIFYKLIQNLVKVDFSRATKQWKIAVSDFGLFTISAASLTPFSTGFKSGILFSILEVLELKYYIGVVVSRDQLPYITITWSANVDHEQYTAPCYQVEYVSSDWINLFLFFFLASERS